MTPNDRHWLDGARRALLTVPRPGPTPDQLAVLIALYVAPAVTYAEHRLRLDLPSYAMSRAVAALARRGWVRKTYDDEGSITLTLNAAGRRVIEAMAAARLEEGSKS